ncbi:unnamed protein product [Anisakis simplex]|uniref:Uncharacterized protein n=1 Tax=Anisakis simplex TaxID=6269 RepID=A0A0M3K0H5_ANISI|nr:unnamed protein product [Anisakis simplex]
MPWSAKKLSSHWPHMMAEDLQSDQSEAASANVLLLFPSFQIRLPLRSYAVPYAVLLSATFVAGGERMEQCTSNVSDNDNFLNSATQQEYGNCSAFRRQLETGTLDNSLVSVNKPNFQVTAMHSKACLHVVMKHSTITQIQRIEQQQQCVIGFMFRLEEAIRQTPF